MSTLKLTRTYAHPQERVWLALTTPELMAEWLMPNDFEPRVGHAFTFRTDPGPGFDGIVRCTVLELEEPRLLAMSWAGGSIDTVLRIELEGVPEGTRLRLTQTGFAGAGGWLVGRLLQLGNRRIYGTRLPAVLERLAGSESDSRPSGDTSCTTRRERFIVRLLQLFNRRQP